MDIAEIDQSIDAYRASGKWVTQNFVKGLDARFYRRILRIMEKTGKPFGEALYRELKKPDPCPTCGKETTWKNARDGCSTYCSSICAGANPETDKKRKATNIKTWGVERPQQHLPKIRAKFLKTMLNSHGVMYGGQSKALRNKAARTAVRNYGSLEAMKAVQKEKSKKTMLERYGVEHLMQDRAYFEAHQKRAFKSESLKIRGKTFSNLRGYEPDALRWMVCRKKIRVSDILTTAEEGVPSYNYNDKGKSRVYYPDMKVKLNGKWYIVEIKSTFTLSVGNTPAQRKSGKFGNVRRKAQAVVDAGDRFILLLVGDSLEKDGLKPVAAIKGIHKKSRKTIIQELQHLHPGRFRQLGHKHCG